MNTEEEKTGGQAFPHGNPVDGGALGMTLRDWFAGQALAGLYAAQIHGLNSDHAATMAHLAYEAADALLTARDGG